MRLPPSVRYLPSRLQFALNPWLWLGVLLTGIVGLYAWEYRQNPGQLPWQLGTTGLGESGDSTSTDVLLESLTPEEQAVAAELDNVELLLAQLDSDITALTTGGESSAAASLNASAANTPTNESSVERLNRYIQEYDFLAPQTRGTGNSSQLIAPVQRPRESVLTFQSGAESSPSASALSEAFTRRQLEQTAPTAAPSATAPRPTVGQTAPAVPTTDATPGLPSGEALENRALSDGASPFSFGQPDASGIVPGSLDGLNRSFIRTTPSMSPPPGTTGYVPPTSLSDFNRLNQPASETIPFGSQPSAGFGVPAPANRPNNTQVLPPAMNSTAPPSEIPAPTTSFSENQNQPPPRNGWESFWD